MGKYYNSRGFTLVEIMLSTLLLSVICLVVWGLLGHYIFFWKQAGDKSDICDSMRLAMNRMSREIKYAAGISATGGLERISFINSEGNSVSYYCLNNQLLRRENGATAPLAGNIESIGFTYITYDGFVIDQTNYDEKKQLSERASEISLITVTITGGKQSARTDPVALTQLINLRVAP